MDGTKCENVERGGNSECRAKPESSDSSVVARWQRQCTNSEEYLSHVRRNWWQKGQGETVGAMRTRRNSSASISG